MPNVIPLNPTSPVPPAAMVRITCGTVTESTDRRDVGRFMYFLTYVDPEGGELSVWDGYSHDDALDAAREWEGDGVQVVDATLPRLN